MIKHIDEKDFGSEVLKNDKLCVVDFYATWCGPCQMLAPVVEEVSEVLGEKVCFYKVDIDKNSDLAIKYDVEVVPTLVYFKNANIVKTEAGYKNGEELKNVIEELI